MQSAGDGTDEEHEDTELAILVVWRTTLASVQPDTNKQQMITLSLNTSTTNICTQMDRQTDRRMQVVS